MLGGACFAALASLRSGCGLTKLVVPEPLVAAALSVAPSATAFGVPVDPDSGDIVPHKAAAVIDGAVAKAQAAVIGPGLGVSPGAIAATLRLVGQPDLPVVVDADGLNCLAEVPDVTPDLHAPLVLTPHIGEFARLARSLDVPGDVSDHAHRIGAAETLARRLGAVIILKSHATIVTDGHLTWALEHPNPVLATAGSGDVLAGLIAGIIAQHVRPHVPLGSYTRASQHLGGMSLYDAARAGVAIHAEAAARWHAESGATGGMLATDLIERIPGAVETFRA